MLTVLLYQNVLLNSKFPLLRKLYHNKKHFAIFVKFFTNMKMMSNFQNEQEIIM